MSTYQPPRRPLHNAYYGKHLIFFPSRKTHVSIACHSALEKDYCVLLEYDVTVIYYESQPGPFHVNVATHPRRYTPDFFVETTESAYYTEVKTDFQKLASRIGLKLEAAKEQFSRDGATLAFADIKSIRLNPKLSNLRFLYLHSFNVSDDEYGACLHLLSKLSYPISLRHILDHPAQVRERAIYRALFSRKIAFDMTPRLSLETLIEEPPHANH
ncbi:Tn7 transposase TnsA N-terminal domain-containing protein [Pseudomonas sp. NPDC098747]|uniref:Tn7 transposase TnsA N-terminal domain-containing protein n=1 Tax=Pseudomonas sp. NPDC098747 TaxID=3364487 RepID=UPI00383A6628